MSGDNLINEIRSELKVNIDEKTVNSFQRFFKEEVKAYGVKTANVHKIAEKYWKEVQNLEKCEIFRLCEELYQSGMIEESFIVSYWAHALRDRYETTDLPLFQSWIERYISNWASCDGFCNHAMGDFFQKFPEFLPVLKEWARSENRWMRRAAAVSLIIPAKHGKFLKEIFEISEILLTDSDDMVRKGYGWLLKEASRDHRDEVYEYVLHNKQVMPRTSLRYAIELMPQELREEAMKKDWK